MHPYPHVYKVTVAAPADGEVTLSGADLPDLPLHAPPEFDGPPGYWSPETLLTAAVASCFVLSFRAIARASKLEWLRVAADDWLAQTTRVFEIFTKAAANGHGLPVMVEDGAAARKTAARTADGD